MRSKLSSLDARNNAISIEHRQKVKKELWYFKFHVKMATTKQEGDLLIDGNTLDLNNLAGQ